MFWEGGAVETDFFSLSSDFFSYSNYTKDDQLLARAHKTNILSYFDFFCLVENLPDLRSLLNLNFETWVNCASYFYIDFNDEEQPFFFLLRFPCGVNKLFISSFSLSFRFFKFFCRRKYIKMLSGFKNARMFLFLFLNGVKLNENKTVFLCADIIKIKIVHRSRMTRWWFLSFFDILQDP